jgi:hypothetical protein
MSAAIALMFMAEAATTCAPADTHRLRAGATIVQAIVSVEPRVFDPAAPKPAASNEGPDSGAGPTANTDEPESGQPANQCKATPTIV